ncbi:MAG: tetratricopeptide repeat protein [Chloroherpetonaceae bacterium]|nr:tetratricopeptide repeat protein [Chloroherpetonaceae bacterium]
MLFARDALAQADSAYRAFNYPLAIALYESVKDDCATAEVFIKLADAYFYGGYELPKAKQEEMYLKAKASLEAALKREPENPDIYARLGQVTGQLALFRGNKEKVKLGLEIKGYADKALALDSKNAMAHAVLGIWHYELAGLGFIERTFAKLLFGDVPEGSYEQAAEHLAKAVAESPNVIFYRNAYAKALLKLGRIEEAKRHLEIALKLPMLVAGDRQNKRESRALLADL